MLELALLASCNSPVRNHLMGCSCVKCADRNLDLLACTAAGRCSLDICGLENTKCIIQSGTHCTEVSSLQDQVSFRRKKPLREVCRHGDHYLAQVCTEYSTSAGLEKPPPRVKKFYIIKGKSCIRVTSLSGTDKFPMPNELIFDLHPECQGGSHYLANAAGFYIIRNEDNTYLHVFDMRCTDYRHNLHESFANGLCYFATDGYFYVVKEHAEFGLVYHRTKDMRSSAGAEMFPVSPSIASIVHRLKPLNQPTNKGIRARLSELHNN